MERFTKIRSIGKGNMGACTLARNNEDGRHYVIKQVDLAKLNKKERQQSLNEAKLLSSLRHPNIINYCDSFLARKSDHLCIVMEFADGGDLSQKVKNAHGAHFGPDQILDWVIQIALALQHIHGRKIIHRDIKTQNIFLTSDGLCKLGDFGIARTLNNTFDQAHTFVGTPYYLSPELILERPYDALSDVWAFGVCMYELMALKHPFTASDMKSLMQRILKVQYDPLPSSYPSELRSIAGRILVKDPARRMKLTEFLELPAVLRRMQHWVQGGAMPARYVSSLVRHKLLPAAVMPTQPNPAADRPLPSLPNSRRPDDIRVEEERRGDVRTEFRDVRLKPKPPGASQAAGTPSYQTPVTGYAGPPQRNPAARPLPSLPSNGRGVQASNAYGGPPNPVPQRQGPPYAGPPPAYRQPDPARRPSGGQYRPPVAQNLPPMNRQQRW